MKGADPVDTFERLAEKPAWMLLRESWIHDPEYADKPIDDLRLRFFKEKEKWMS